jgi:hypothetical protein
MVHGTQKEGAMWVAMRREMTQSKTQSAQGKLTRRRLENKREYHFSPCPHCLPSLMSYSDSLLGKPLGSTVVQTD